MKNVTILGRRTALIMALAIGVFGPAPDRVDAQDQPSSLSETYGSWVVQCSTQVGSEEDKERTSCQMSQELTQRETGERVLLAALTLNDASADVAMTLVAPFGLLLPEGISLSVDGDMYTSIVFRTCLPRVGCLAKTDVSDNQRGLLTEGQTLSIGMVAETGQKIQANLSLEGFSSALARLSEFES